MKSVTLRKSACVSVSLLGLLFAPIVSPARAQPAPQPQTQAPQPQPQGSPQPQEALQPQVAPQPQGAPQAQSNPQPQAHAIVTLQIGTSGGAYLRSQELAIFEPFTERHGHHIKPAFFEGGYDALKTQAPTLDVVNVDGATLARGCTENLLEPLDANILEPAAGAASPADDFLPGAIQPCGIANVAWSAVVVYNKNAKRTPTKFADFFDTRRYPGKRLLLRGPKYNFELALLADGVAPADIYSTLSTPEGQARALRKLNSIKNNIVWFDRPSEFFDLITQKGNAMGVAFNGRAFMAIVNERKPLAILWERQIYSFDYWAIPRGSKNVDAAKEFIRFATSSISLADQARYLPYGPARRSAARFPVKHSELDMEMKTWLPTHEPNLKGALAFDPVWWSNNEATLNEQFLTWQEGRKPTTGGGNTPQ